MASKATSEPNSTPEVTFYMLGKPVPSGTFPKLFIDGVLAMAKQNLGNFVPTTYEASKAYLDEESSKPLRNLYREMCMIIVADTPDDQEISLVDHTLGAYFQLSKGTMLVVPTMNNPPTAFGTPQNQTSDRFINTKSSEPARPLIMLTYFSKTT